MHNPKLLLKTVSTNTAEISVVVQGPITEFTNRTLESVRKYLPQSKIILSTWKDSNVDNLDFDEVVFNIDPYNNSNRYPTNLNRMLLSTLSGLKKVETKYILKIRTDFILIGRNFLNLFFQKTPRRSNLKLLKENVVCYAWKPQAGRLLQCGDFYFFGLTCDIIQLFDIPFSTDEEFFWLDNHKATNPNLKAKNPNRYHPEQHIWIKFLEKNGIKIDLKDYTHFNINLKILTEKSFANNLIFASFYDFSIVTPKPQLLGYNNPKNMRGYDYRDWIELKQKYLSKKFYPDFIPAKISPIILFLSYCIKMSARFLTLFYRQKQTRANIRATGNKIRMSIIYNEKI